MSDFIEPPLRLPDETLRAVFEHAPAATLISDKNGRIVGVNRQVEVIFGYGRHELLGQSIDILVPARFREGHARHRAGFYSQPRTRPMGEPLDLQARRKDGTELPVDISLSPCVQNGDLFIIASVRDITRRKQAEALLQQRFRELQTLHEIGKIIITSTGPKSTLEMILDITLTIGRFNIGVIRLLDPQTMMLNEASSRGYRFPRNIRPLSVDPESPLVGQAQAAVFKTQGAHVSENVPLAAGFRTFKLEGVRSAVVVPVRTETQMIGTLQLGSRVARRFTSEEIRFLETIGQQLGIAAQKLRLLEETFKSADELTLKMLELERANAAKDDFLGLVSHELRTPLNVIMGYTSLLQEGLLGDVNPEQHDALNKTTLQCHSLLHLVNSILRAAQIAGGDINLALSPVSLSHFLEELKSKSEVSLGKNVTMVWRFPSDLPTVETDPVMLTEILHNLIDNASKFTERGSIKIAARYSPRNKTVLFKVTDSGSGIPKELLPTIFELFRQVDSSKTRLYGGAGLGLFIVKRYTELLGGKIEVKSSTGKGTVFTVAIPFGK